MFPTRGQRLRTVTPAAELRKTLTPPQLLPAAPRAQPGEQSYEDDSEVTRLRREVAKQNVAMAKKDAIIKEQGDTIKDLSNALAVERARKPKPASASASKISGDEWAMVVEGCEFYKVDVDVPMSQLPAQDSSTSSAAPTGLQPAVASAGELEEQDFEWEAGPDGTEPSPQIPPFCGGTTGAQEGPSPCRK